MNWNVRNFLTIKANVEIINFDIIHHKCRRSSLHNLVEYYKTISKNDSKNYPENEKKVAMSVAMQPGRKDLWIRDLIIEHLKL